MPQLTNKFKLDQVGICLFTLPLVSNQSFELVPPQCSHIQVFRMPTSRGALTGKLLGFILSIVYSMPLSIEKCAVSCSQAKLIARNHWIWIGKMQIVLLCNHLLNKKKDFWSNGNFLIRRNGGLK